MQTEFKKEPEKQLTSPDKLEPLKLNSNKLLEQRPRSSGFKSFLNWFKKVENLQRSTEDNSSSLSSSDEESSDSSTSSTATVASFAFLPANVYKPYGDAKQPEKFIAPGPYTETYRKLILERNRRRNLDKNLSLRKKYSLYSSGTLGSKLEMHVQAPKKLDHNENIDNVQVYDTFSLPSIAKKGLIGLDNFKDNRRTASLSSRDNKTPNYCHVKGKRKAPQPPINPEFVRSNRKKRQAPAPPKQLIENNKTEENKTNQDNQSSVIPVNLLLNQDKDKSVFDPDDILKNKLNLKNDLSPKPWYKRQSSENKSKQKNSKNDSNKKKNKHEYPEIGFFRYSRIFENKKLSYSDNSEQDNKQDKRASCLLPNISELDREAAEIIKHKKDLENQCNGGNNVEDIAANKPSSARDLINKFNALTNATNAPLAPSNIVLSKVEEKKVDMKSPIAIISRKFYKGVIDDDSKINNHNKLKNDLNETNTNLTSNQTDLLKVSKTEVFGARKICTTCYNQNNTSGNTCINCIKSQLDKIEANNQDNQNISKTSNSESSKSFQAEVFSAIPNFNFPLNKTSIINDENISTKENAFERSSQALKKISDSEEKIRLREMLKEMKNSLPKRPKPEKPINGSKAEADSKPRDKLIIASESPGIEKLSAHCDKDILPIVKTGQVSAIMDKFTSNENEVLNSEKSDIAKGKVLGSEQIRNRDVMVSKVSSSAQTNCISKKTDLILNAQKQTVLEKVEEKNSNENISNQLYMNIEESKMLASKGKNSDSQMSVNTKLLLKQLEAAIAQGNDLLAAKLAKDLALLKVNCSVTSTYTIQLKENNKQSVQIYIEDQFSHQGPIPLKVEGNITIAGLKSQVSKVLHIPAGVQRWIIGKQLTIDDNLPLVHYNKNNFENPLFLYVVASEPKQEKITKVENLKDLRSSAESLNKATKEEIKIDIEVSRSSVGSDKDKKINIVDEKKGDEKIKINLKNVEKKVIKPGTSKIVITNESPPLKDVVKKTWICSACTLINSLLSPLCSACGSKKPDSPDISNKSKDNASATEDKNHYLQLVNLDNSELVPNLEKFECPVCLTDCNPNAGVVLRECLHTFCKDCLANIVKFSEEAEIKCPYRDNEYFCDSVIQEREIKALVNKALYEQHLAKSVNFAENKIKNAFHCKTPDCKGWCIFEENVNDFRCPVCKKTNCLTCQAIHEGKNCKEYQEQINNDDTTSSADGQRTKQMLEDMVNKGEAMICPSCQVVLMKKWGCDWLRCSMCKTEICWVTRGPRWGPAGKGDTSGGCQCGLNGVKCHPKCNYCH